MSALTAEDILRRTQGDKFNPNAAVLESERKELADRAQATAVVAPAVTPAVPAEERTKITPVAKEAPAPAPAPAPAELPVEVALAEKKFEEATTPSPLDIEAAVKPISRRR